MADSVRGLSVCAAAIAALALAVSSSWAVSAAPEPQAIVPMADTTPPANYTMDVEPAFTNGTANTVSWSAGDDPGGSTPIEYYAEVSRLLGFGTIEDNSGWITSNSTTFSGLQDGIGYYYHVRARDSSGNVGGFSAATFSTQDAAPPSSPIIGAEPAYTVGTSNSIVWGSSTDGGVGGVEYFAEASTSSTFATIAASSGWVAGTSTSFAGLTGGTTYYFHVKSRDSLGHEAAWSAVVFSTQDASAPTVPVINAEPAYTAGSSNTISWPASTDAGVGGVEYQVEFSASPTFASGIVTSAWQTSTSYTATPLSGGTPYFYRVKARDAFAQASSPSTIVSSEQDNTPPTVPAISGEPLFTNGTTNAIAWGASTETGSGGVQYFVEMSRSAAFTTIEDSSGWISGTTFTFTKLDDGVAYFYHVKARDALALESAFSGSTSSTQDSGSPTVPLVAAEPSFTSGTSNTITWVASTDSGVGGIQYFVEMSTSSTFSPLAGTAGWALPTSASFAGLTDGQIYYYRVKARDAFLRESSFSLIVSSTQDNSAPTIPVIAAEPTYTQGTSNTISWSASTDASSGGVQYFLQFSTSPSFAFGVTTIGPQSTLTGTVSSLADGTTYYYRVIAFDALSIFSPFSATANSTQDNRAPAVPSITAEPSFTSGSSNTVAWAASADATSGGVQYYLEQSRSSTFTTIEDTSDWISALSFSFAKLDDAVTYFYRVKARDAVLIESAFSSSTSSTQDASPPTVPLLNPEPAFTSGLSNTISWGASADAGVGGITYMAERSASPVFATIDATAGWAAATSATFASLTDATTYYYRVKTRDSFLRESAYSTLVASTQDNAGPTAPAMIAEPGFTTGTSNTVSWTASADAGVGGVVYDVQIATNIFFIGATTQSGLTATSFTFTGLGDGTLYYYRARSRDSFGSTAGFSASTNSRQDASGPSAPVMNAEPGYTAGTTNAVSWTASVDSGVGGVEYLVQSSTSALFSSISDSSGWVASTSFTFTRLDDGQTYYFRVQARDAFGWLSNTSSAVSSTQDNSAPAVPLPSPEPAFTQGTSNTISWGVAVDAGVGGVDYQYRYSTSPTFASGVTTSAFQSATSATIAGLSDTTAYYYQVRARDAFGFTTAWSSVAASTQDASPPSTPAATTEPSYTSGSTNTVSWSVSTDAGVGGIQYWIEYASSPSFATVLGNSGWTSATSNTFFGLNDGVRYYYRVKARDAFLQESSFSGSTNSQQDASPPSVPASIAFATYSNGNFATFAWGASFDAGVGGIEYEAQVAATAGFATVLDSSGWTSTTSSTFLGLLDQTTYYFRVRARDAFAYTSNFSTVRNTTMDSSPPTTPVVNPEPAFTRANTNTISWPPSVDAGVGNVAYQLSYSDSPAFTGPGTVVMGGVSSPTTISGLLDGITYYFRVRASDSFAHVSPWSQPVSSTQDASPPTIPQTNTLPFFIDGWETLLTWQQSTDAGVGGIEYQARAAEDPFFTNIVETSPWSTERSYLFSSLSDATIYYYQVRARDAFNYMSLWSFPEVAMNDFLPPPVPQIDPMPTFSKGLSAFVSWRTVFDAGVGGEEYQVLAFTAGDLFNPFAAGPWVTSTSTVIGGLPEGEPIYFAVRVRDQMGHTSAPSLMEWTIPDNSPPPVPTLTALPPFTSGLNLTLAWSAVADAGVGGELYRVQVSSDPSFSSGVFDSGWVSQTFYTAGPLVDGRLYFARVRSQDAFSFSSSWSALERTQMDASPPTAPALGALPSFTAGSQVTLAWTTALDAGVGGVTYDAQVSTNASFATLWGESGWGSATDWTFSGLSDGTRYYFRVYSRDAFLRVSSFSPAVFSTMDASAPTPPELLVMSAFTAGLQQNVRWSPAVDLGVGGVEYFVESATNDTFAQGAVSSGWITALQYTFAGLADGGKYYFRVHARDSFGYTSNWSTVRNATMDDTAPTLSADQSAVLTNVGDAALTGSASDAVSGIFDVAFSTDGGVLWTTATGKNPWQASLTGLVEGTTVVIVKARDLVGHESALVRVPVTVDETAPLVAFQSPTNGSLLTGLVGVYAIIDDPNFASFRLQQRVVGRANYTDIISNGTLTRGDNFLGLWDTRTLANGLYELRLTALDSLGQLTARTIQVRLLNSDLAVSYSDLQISDRAPTTGDHINVTAVVTNFGTAAAENVTVHITDNGVLIFDQGGITIAPHASFTADVPYVVDRAGPHSFQLEWSYSEGAADTGTMTSTVIEAQAPPVPEPKPFLVEYAGALGPIMLIALAALGITAGWAIVQIARLRRAGPAGPAAYGAEAVEVEWESDEMF